MSALYGELFGAGKTVAKKRGHGNLTGHIRGWDVGVEVACRIGPMDEVIIDVYRTGGSNKPGRQDKIATVVSVDYDCSQL